MSWFDSNMSLQFMSVKTHDNEGWENNRYKSLRITRKSKFYCSCDMEGVGKGEKCSHTNNVGGGKKKLKKY